MFFSYQELCNNAKEQYLAYSLKPSSLDDYFKFNILTLYLMYFTMSSSVEINNLFF